VPTPQSFRDSLLDNRLTDSCWSVESTRDIQSLDGVITSIRILKLSSPLFASSTPSQEASPLLRHRIMDGTLSWGNFSPCFSNSFFIVCCWEWLEDVLGRNKERLVEWRLYQGLYASLFSYDMNVNIFKAFCELWCHTTNTFCTESGDMSISLWDMCIHLTTKESFYSPGSSLLQERTTNNSRLAPSSFQHSTDYAKM